MRKQKLSRRTFLQSATAATFAAKLNPASAEPTAKTEIPYPENGVARQLAAAGAFTYRGTVGDYRAPWMGNWYFVREHPIYAGLPVNQVMRFHYQTKGRQANGLLIKKHPNGADIDIIAAYSRDHDRNIGVGTFTTTLGQQKSSTTASPSCTLSCNNAS